METIVKDGYEKSDIYNTEIGFYWGKKCLQNHTIQTKEIPLPI